MVPLSFSGRDFVADASGALYWPAERALLVADLHLEKASWFARFGQMLPPYDSLATLERLAGVAAKYRPRAIYCLGDNFHDREGEARLGESAAALLRSLTRRYEWHWISGNHDPAPAGLWGGRPAREIALSGVMLRHAVDSSDSRPEISGHYHPKLRLSVRGKGVSRACFVRGETRLILPAFGALTGGLDAGHEAIVSAAGEDCEALVALDNRLLRFPAARDARAAQGGERLSRAPH